MSKFYKALGPLFSVRGKWKKKKGNDLGIKDLIHPSSTTAMNMFSYLGQVSLSHLFCLGLKQFIVVAAAFVVLFKLKVFQDGSDIIEATP